MLGRLSFVVLNLILTNPVYAEKERIIEYSLDGKTFEGFSVEAPIAKPKGAVLIIHDWMGLTEKTKVKARKVAALGYSVLAIDVFGKGVRPKNPDEAKANSAAYYADRKMFRARVTAGLDQITQLYKVPVQKVAAIGYCFGGTGVLELARTGAKVAGVVSFHGGLDSTNVGDGKRIRTKVLALQGANDPYVPAEHLRDFEEEMKMGNLDWQLVKYGGAVHSFTDPTAGNDSSKGAAYDEKADNRSWEEMKRFFSEIF